MELLIKIFFIAIWFVVFGKLFLFWLWLWQLKNYHLGRFRAHFEAQKLKKAMASLYRLKIPNQTKKILAIECAWFLALAGFFVFAGRQTDDNFRLLMVLFVLFLPLIASVFILLFQIPTLIWQAGIMRKAKNKIKGFDNLIVIGVSGSFGKTSTKEFLAAVLKEKYNVLKTSEHINAEVGIAQTILREINNEHQVFVAEIGAYQKGKIKQVCDMVKPKIGILTGINEQHLATFGSRKNIIRAKFEILRALGQEGTAILNNDSEMIRESAQEISKLVVKTKIFCSSETTADLWAENVTVEKNSISFVARSKDGDEALFRADLIGRQNAVNLLMAAACCKKLGMSLAEVAKACAVFKQNNLKKGINGVEILDYTYSANPASVWAHLEYLKTAYKDKDPNTKIVMIMPCLIELGSASKRIHHDLGKEIARICDLSVITTKDRFRELNRGANEAKTGHRMLMLENPREIWDQIKDLAREGNVILLESRVPKALMDMLEIK
ncbi:MAG: UDP-N-acetylmuramoyl-tripeptide--D-alanyl-D-alanine ligase [Candidatus Pacebacteria bacterium]|nr:UDP-N-acetylmuramoyl-tripeptide--D-alanyl-D-alanine ligase [Candidatus Paceibacterota bacterium]